MKRSLIGVGVVFLALLFTSCVDQIPFGLKESTNQYLIIDASIRDTDNRHLVTVKINGASSGGFQADQPVNGASISIVRSDGATYDFVNSNEKGEYWNSNLRPKQGYEYKLNVVYDGIEYESSSESLLSSLPVESVYTLVTNEARNNEIGNVVKTELVNVFADAQLPTDEDVYIKYGVAGTYEYREIGTQTNLNPGFCWVDETIELDNISLATNMDLPTGKLADQFVIQRIIDYRFSTNYCMKVYQERISKGAFTFWKSVENEYSRTGDIFEKPPGILRGNIIETQETDVSAVGLFSIAAVDSFLHLIIPSDVNSPQPQCQPFPPPPATCTNCLLLPKSTETRPECFR